MLLWDAAVLHRKMCFVIGVMNENNCVNNTKLLTYLLTYSKEQSPS